MQPCRWARPGLVAILSVSNSAFFRPYFGKIPPLAVIGLLIPVGALCLYILYSKGWFYVFNPPATLRGIALAAAIVALFAVEVTVFDVIAPFPQDINVPLPQSLLFYPAIAYVVEIVFHVLPLTLVLLALDRFGGRIPFEHLVWIGIVLVALLEPTYQLAFLGRPISSAGAYLWARLFVFSLIQLALFRRFDFVTMLSFRLFYYAVLAHPLGLSAPAHPVLAPHTARLLDTKRTLRKRRPAVGCAFTRSVALCVKRANVTPAACAPVRRPDPR